MNLEKAIKSSPLFNEEKWKEFFEGKWHLNRLGGGFSETVFFYQDKIWYGNEKDGSGMYYAEGSVSNVIPIFLNPETHYNKSCLNEKMSEVMIKRKEGLIISDGLGTYDFKSLTEAVCECGEQHTVKMYDLGEFLSTLSIDPLEYKYVKKGE
jgi:hypothetical protein